MKIKMLKSSVQNVYFILPARLKDENWIPINGVFEAFSVYQPQGWQPWQLGPFRPRFEQVLRQKDRFWPFLHVAKKRRTYFESKLIFNHDISGLQLSLQSQSLMYIQAFDNEKRQCLTALLEQEKWKKSDMVRVIFISIICSKDRRAIIYWWWLE